jgi:hypothetical protein
MNSLKAFAVYSEGTPLVRFSQNQQHGAMLFAHHVDEDNECVLVLPAGSVRSFFRREGRGMALHVEPGPFAFADAARHCESVRAAILTEAGRALNVPSGEVLSLSFDRLKTIAKPEGVQRNPWESRKRTRGLFVGYSR